MPRTKTITTYTYAELKERGGSAYEKAKQWLIEGQFDHNWWEYCYDDFIAQVSRMGWEVDAKDIDFELDRGAGVNIGEAK